MKFKNILAGIVFGSVAVVANATIILPITGDSEIVFVAIDFGGTTNSFTLDTGIKLSEFDPAANKAFNLQELSTFWSTFKSSATGTVQFGLLAADGAGPNSGVDSRVILATDAVGNGPSLITNSRVATPSSNVGSAYLQQVSGALDNTVFTSSHRDQVNGSSINLGGAGATGSNVFQANFTTPLNVSLIAAGTKAEFFRFGTVVGSTAAFATVTDYFASTETSTNVGGFWNLDLATNLLTYKGAPDIVIVPPPPVPEPAEWAMMLAGLGLVGFAARRRQAKRNVTV